LFSFARREAPSLTAFSKAQWLGLFWLIAAGAFFALDLFCLHWLLRRTSVVNATLFLNTGAQGSVVTPMTRLVGIL
jgi:hypothetical protein